MLSVYRNPRNSHRRRQKISNCEYDLERPQMISNDPKKPQLTSKESSLETVEPKKNKFKGGANKKMKDKYLNVICHNISL